MLSAANLVPQIYQHLSESLIENFKNFEKLVR